MPGTFYVPLPRRLPISGIDCEALYTTHRESVKNTLVEKKLHVYLLVKFDALLDNHLPYTLGALMWFYSNREGTRERVINSPFFDDVGMMLSRLEKV